MQDWAKVVYKRKRWQKCRAAYIAHRVSVDGGLCEECHDALGYIVHHRVALTEANVNDPDICYGWRNLEYVCKTCHDKFEGHGVGESLTPRVEFDAEGNPLPPPCSCLARAAARTDGVGRKDAQAARMTPCLNGQKWKEMGRVENKYWLDAEGSKGSIG